MRATLFLAAILVGTGSAGRAMADTFISAPLCLDPVLLLQAEPKPHAVVGALAHAQSYGVTGDWLGVRKQLHDQGISVGGHIWLDIAKNFRGGLSTNDWPVSYLLSVCVTVDLERILGWTGATFFLDFQSHDQSEDGDTTVGDIQGYNNITSTRFVQVAQFWYKQRIGDLVRIKVGKFDANADGAAPGLEALEAFSLLAHSPDFLNSAAVYAPTMFPMATYPDPPVGGQIFLGEPARAYLGAGAFYSNRNQSVGVIMGQPESVEWTSGGAFLIAEAGMRWSLTGSDLPGHAGVGGWYHTGDFPRVSDGMPSGNGAGGGYVFIDHALIYRETETVTQDLGVFFHAGLSDSPTAPADRSLTLGLAASGFVPGRPDDSFGVMASWIHISDQPGLRKVFELATEAYYRLQVTPWAALKPSFQYIVNPGGMHRDAAVLTLRAEMDF